MMRQSACRLERACWIVLFVGIANWMICLIVAYVVGGDAWGGYVEGGHVYVESRGTYAEVSQATFLFTKVHLVVSATLLPVAGVAGMIAALLREHRLNS